MINARFKICNLTSKYRIHDVMDPRFVHRIIVIHSNSTEYIKQILSNLWLFCDSSMDKKYLLWIMVLKSTAKAQNMVMVMNYSVAKV